jgi:predicted neutral ceramidase superfamily lipid hydrolase
MNYSKIIKSIINTYTEIFLSIMSVFMLLIIVMLAQASPIFSIIYFFGLFFSLLTLVNVEAVIGKLSIYKLFMWVAGSWLSTGFWFFAMNKINKEYDELKNKNLSNSLQKSYLSNLFQA